MDIYRFYLKRARAHDVIHGNKMFEVLAERRSEKSNSYSDGQNINAADEFTTDNWWESMAMEMDSSFTNNNISTGTASMKFPSPKFSINEPAWETEHDSANMNTGSTISGGGSSSSSSSVTKTSAVAKFSINEPMWGTEHPDFNSQNRRITWSIREKDYIKDWLECNGQQTKCRAMELLKHIRRDTDSHKIFHVNHIVDTTRLRHGIRLIDDAEKAQDIIYYTEI